MKTVLGVPGDSLLAFLLVAVGASLAILAYAAWRRPILFRLGVRNIPRRRMQSVLICLGLALSTVIVSSAMITGDTVTHSLRLTVADALGPIDELVSPLSVRDLTSGTGNPGQGLLSRFSNLSDLPLIPRDTYLALRDQLKDDPLVDGLAPLVLVPCTVRNVRSGLGEPVGFIVGVGPEYEQQFGLHTADGRAATVAELRPGLGGLFRIVSPLLGTTGLSGQDASTGLPETLRSLLLGGQDSNAAGDVFAPNQTTRLILEADRTLASLGLELPRAEVYLSEPGARKLAARPGDELQLLVGPIPIVARVKDMVSDAGPLALFGPVMVVHIDEMQTLFSSLGLGDQYVALVVSNRGGTLDSVESSQPVSQRLRQLLMNRSAADELIALLRTPEVSNALKAEADKLPARQQQLARQVTALQGALGQPTPGDGLYAALSDPDLGAWLGSLPLPDETGARLKALLQRANPHNVEPIKAFALEQAELAGEAALLLLVFAGSFSILAGALLIFLIFVTLASARKSEMGIARAVGTQRHHLIQMFVNEGVVYDLIAAALGVLAGSLVSGVGMSIVANLISTVNNSASQLRVQFYAETRSLLIAFCLGLLFTLIVIALASWWVSRLNIVAAIRDVPAWSASGRRAAWLRRNWRVVCAVPLVAAGAWLVGNATSTRSETQLLMGSSLAIIAGGLLGGVWLQRKPRHAAWQARLIASGAGVGLLLVWAVPWLNWLGVNTFERDETLFVLAGIMLIAGAVWSVMHNADGLLWVINRLLGGLGALTPVLRLATAYPLASRLRTAMAMAMFAVIIFIVTTMAIVIRTQQVFFAPSAAQSAGFDIRVTTTLPLRDLAAEIEGQADLSAADINGVGWSAVQAIEMRQAGVSGRMTDRRLVGVDDGFIDQAQAVYTFQLRAPGYETDQAVWQALRQRDDVLVVSPFLIRSGSVADARPNAFYLEGVERAKQQLPPLTLEMRLARGTNTALTRYQVIGVLSQPLNAANASILGHARAITRLTGKPALPATYYIKVRPGADATALAQALERTFQLYGMDARSYREINAEIWGTASALLQLLQGFMAMGLVVGITALGVISGRNVVERRQYIGMLRAIGFRPALIGAWLLLESSFVSLTGILIGTALGIAVSANMVSGLSSTQSGLTLSLPWAEMAVITLLAYGFSLVTTILPAWQAARIYPAEALRYEG